MHLEDDRLCLLCAASCEAVGPVSLRRLAAGARRDKLALAAALGLGAAELAGRYGLARGPARALAALADPRARGLALLRELAAAGVRPVFEGELGYPLELLRLGDSAPAVLFLAGDAGALEARRIAVVGSRTPTRAARAGAQSFAQTLARAGVTVVSGGARGIDMTAHAGALRGGATAAVPAMGVLRFEWAGCSPDAVRGGRWCVVGQFPPDSEWQTRQALMRNRTIAALADAVVAFEPRDCGGTWRTCLLALQMRKPLFLVTASSGACHARALVRLVRMGATALDPCSMPDAEEFAQLARDYEPVRGAAQTGLFAQGGPEDGGDVRPGIPDCGLGL